MRDTTNTKHAKKVWLIFGVIYCLSLLGLLFWIGQLSPPPATKISGISVDPASSNLVIDGENLSSYLSAVLTPNLQTPQTTISDNSTWAHVRDIAVQGHNIWLASGSTGVICYDIHNPFQPILKAVVPLTGISWKLAIADNKLFVAAGKDGLFILDIEDSSTPKVISTLTDYIVLDIAIKGNMAVLATAKHGLVFIDTSDLNNPKQIVTPPTAGNLQAVTIQNNYVYGVGKSDNGGILHVFHVATERHPQHVASVKLPQTAWACITLGTHLLIALGNDGVYACDISDPQQPPKPIKTIITHNAFGLCTDDNKLFVTSLSDHVYQYTYNHGMFQQAQTILLSSNCRDAATYDHLLIAAKSGDGFVIMDPSCESLNTEVAVKLPGLQYRKAKILTHNNTVCVRNARSLFLLHENANGAIELYDSVDFKQTIRTVTMDARYVYIALNNHQIHILDLRQDASQRTRAVLELAQTIHNLSSDGTYLYASLSPHGLTVFETSKIGVENPAPFEFIDTLNSAAIRQGSLIYVAALPNCLKIYRVDNAHKATLISTLDYATPLQTRAPASELAIVGKYLFITNGDNGILSIDISNADKPKLVDSIDLGGFCSSIVVQGDIACVTTNQNKIKIVNIGNPKQLRELCELPATRSVALMNDQLLQLTDQGIAIHPIPQPLPIITQRNNKTKFHLPGIMSGNFDLQIATKDSLLHYSDILTVNPSGTWEMTRPFSELTSE